MCLMEAISITAAQSWLTVIKLTVLNTFDRTAVHKASSSDQLLINDVLWRVQPGSVHTALHLPGWKALTSQDFWFISLPRVQLSWRALSSEHPALKPVQLHRILTQYQLTAEIGPVPSWQPSSEDEAYIYRTGTFYLSGQPSTSNECSAHRKRCCW